MYYYMQVLDVTNLATMHGNYIYGSFCDDKGPAPISTIPGIQY